MSVDPIAEDFPELTTYQYAGNTPIQAIDLDGLEPLVLTGREQALEKFKRVVNNGTGGFRSTSIDPSTGRVSLEKTDKAGSPNERQGEFIGQMEGLTQDDGNEFSVGIVESSEDVLIGSFPNETIDIDDIENFGNGEFVSSSGTLTHELVEQKAKQVDGTEFTPAHEAGTRAENKVNGVDSKGKTLPTSIGMDSFGLNGMPVTGTLKYKASKNVEGKVFPETRIISLTIEKNNVTGAEENKEEKK